MDTPILAVSLSPQGGSRAHLGFRAMYGAAEMHGGTLAGFIEELDGAAERADAFAHAEQAECF